MKTVLIAGCGDVGIAVARLFDDAQVYGLRRRTSHLPDFIHPVAGDLTRSDGLESVPDHVDLVVYSPTPSERSEKGYRAAFIDGVRNLSRVCTSPSWIFVSSTAVYGQDDGQWVDEDSATEPARYNGRLLLQAEKEVLQHGGIVIRSGGIYGPGREYLIRRVEEGASARSRHYTNRIHRDDLAAAIKHLGVSGTQGVYNAVDHAPCTEAEVMASIAEQLQLPVPKIQITAPSNKRIHNRKLAATGFAFQFPDYRVGYAHVINSRT